jgi:hypothetical protein
LNYPWNKKRFFSIFNRSGAARIVFIHRYFLTSVNRFTNFPLKPTDPANALLMSLASAPCLFLADYISADMSLNAPNQYPRGHARLLTKSHL